MKPYDIRDASRKGFFNPYSLQTMFYFLTCGSFSFSTNDACFEPLRWTGFESKGLKKVQDNLRYNNRSFKE
jgi:hypothetical protein